MKRVLGLALSAMSCAATLAAVPPEFESSVLAALNLARQQPTSLIPALETMLGNFHGTMLIREGKPSLVTLEGAPAVREAVDFLRRIPSCEPLEWNDGLARAAQDLVDDQSASGETGHIGSDGSFTGDRVNRHGEWRDRLGENIVYGSETAEAVALDTVIDDGVAHRGHREALFECAYRLVGVACGEHPWYRRMCVMVFASGMSARPRLAAPPLPATPSPAPPR